MDAARSDTPDRAQHALGGPPLMSADDLPVDHHLEEILGSFAVGGNEPQAEAPASDAATA
jgi:hypothetical protein